MMVSTSQRGAFLRRGLVAGFLLTGMPVLVACAQARAEAQAEGEAPSADRTGWVFRINLPITSPTYARVTRFTRNAVDRAAAAGVEPVLIFEFVVPPDQSESAASSNFGASLDLADYLYDEDFLSKKAADAVGQVTTVAYVPGKIQGHAVLVALACDQILMRPEGEIGPADIDEPNVTPLIHSAYEEIARRKIPVAVALGLADRRTRVLQVEAEVSREYVLGEKLEELRQRRTVIGTPKVLFDAGEPGRLSGRQAHELGIVDYLALDRRELARLLKLPPKWSTRILH